MTQMRELNLCKEKLCVSKERVDQEKKKNRLHIN